MQIQHVLRWEFGKTHENAKLMQWFLAIVKGSIINIKSHLGDGHAFPTLAYCNIFVVFCVGAFDREAQ